MNNPTTMEWCVCGHIEEQHIDNCEQCVIPNCGCREFESVGCANHNEPMCEECSA